jgi:hypothetical protein
MIQLPCIRYNQDICQFIDSMSQLQPGVQQSQSHGRAESDMVCRKVLMDQTILAANPRAVWEVYFCTQSRIL